MKKVQAYRCEYCGKVYLLPHACSKHEERNCRKNPRLQPLCYHCKHYEAAPPSRVTTIYLNYDPEEDWASYKKNFTDNRCKRMGDRLHLYNRICLTKEMKDALHASGFIAMPLPSEGCQLYEFQDPHQCQKPILP